MIKCKIEINEDGTIGVRMRRIVEVDGEQIDVGYHRALIDVDDDPETKLVHPAEGLVPDVLARVQAIIPIAHTPDVVNSRRAARAAANGPR